MGTLCVLLYLNGKRIKLRTFIEIKTSHWTSIISLTWLATSVYILLPSLYPSVLIIIQNNFWMNL